MATAARMNAPERRRPEEHLAPTVIEMDINPKVSWSKNLLA